MSVERAVCVSLHDVSPATWPLCERLIAALYEVAPVPLTLLVVPDYHRLGSVIDASYRNALNALVAQGSELALHGFYHLDEAPPSRCPLQRLTRSHYTASEGEFSALTVDEASERLHKGLAWFASHGWQPSGFVAPAWLMSRGTWQALQPCNFEYVTTLKDFCLPWSGRKVRSQSLVYSTRSVARGLVSRLWNRWLFNKLENKPLMRLSLHPNDALYPEVVRDWQNFLARALHTRVALTKADFARRATADPVQYGVSDH